VSSKTDRNAPQMYFLDREYTDKNGNKISGREMALLMEDMEYRRVGYTETSQGITVSTVWTPIDGAFGSGRNFETMVKRSGGSWCGCWPYQTQAEAEAGHRELVERFSRPIKEAADALSRLTGDEEWVNLYT